MAVRIKLIFSIFLIIIFLGGASFSYNFYKTISRPLSRQGPEYIIEIKRGSSIKRISYLLSRKGIIGDSLSFNLLARLKGEASKLKAGEYRLSPAMSPSEILEKITRGKVAQRRITIPEGLSVYEIGSLLEKNNFTKKDSFVAAAFNAATIGKLGFKTDSLEGYLFPETYYFEKTVSNYEILKKMTDIFREKAMTATIMSDTKKSSLSFHEVVTLASLIEKETGKEKERPLISAVFHNRLKKKMRLQCDPTVIYAIKDFDGNIRKKDLDIDSPYNTYRFSGLPPGPIANPGLRSIETALHPASVNYIYFVAKKNGEHKFSSTLRDHNQAVLKYQLRRKSTKAL